MALDDEAVRQRQGDRSARCVRQARGLGERAPRLVRVEQIALQVEDAAALDQGGIHVVGGQLDPGAQIGAHGPLAVGCDVDQAASRRGTGGEPGRGKGGAQRAQILSEHVAQPIGRDLADEGRPAAEAGDAGDGVAGRAARGLDPRRHRAVQRLGARLVDQHHRRLGHIVSCEEGVVRWGDHIDEGVADRRDVIVGVHTLSATIVRRP
jgi:hypothetical protein